MFSNFKGAVRIYRSGFLHVEIKAFFGNFIISWNKCQISRGGTAIPRELINLQQHLFLQVWPSHQTALKQLLQMGHLFDSGRNKASLSSPSNSALLMR